MIPKKPAPGLDPGVETGFRKRSCSNKKLEPHSDSIKNDKALASYDYIARRGKMRIKEATP
jgi:hypothetical protein